MRQNRLEAIKKEKVSAGWRGTKSNRGWEEGHEKGETICYRWRNILDAGCLLPSGWSQALPPRLLRTEKVLHRFWQVGGKNPVATFSGKNCSGLPAASLPRGLCSPGVCVPGRLKSLPTSHAHPSLSNSVGHKFIREDCLKQNLGQSCSKDSEVWGGKLKDLVHQAVFATLLLSHGFGKERILWKRIARLGRWQWWEDMAYSGSWARKLER